MFMIMLILSFVVMMVSLGFSFNIEGSYPFYMYDEIIGVTINWTAIILFVISTIFFIIIGIRYTTQVFNQIIFAILSISFILLEKCQYLIFHDFLFWYIILGIISLIFVSAFFDDLAVKSNSYQTKVYKGESNTYPIIVTLNSQVDAKTLNIPYYIEKNSNPEFAKVPIENKEITTINVFDSCTYPTIEIIKEYHKKYNGNLKNPVPYKDKFEIITKYVLTVPKNVVTAD